MLAAPRVQPVAVLEQEVSDSTGDEGNEDDPTSGGQHRERHVDGLPRDAGVAPKDADKVVNRGPDCLLSGRRERLLAEARREYATRGGRRPAKDGEQLRRRHDDDVTDQQDEGDDDADERRGGSRTLRDVVIEPLVERPDDVVDEQPEHDDTQNLLENGREQQCQPRHDEPPAYSCVRGVEERYHRSRRAERVKSGRGRAGGRAVVFCRPVAHARIMTYNYEELGLVAGLEIHQQLDTATKLFCGCPTERRDPEASTRSFTRYLHPTRSELGEIDEAALEESRVEREFTYLGYDSTCLVEEDDEPPARLDDEALETTLEIAALLDATVVDQAHVMRKLVIDGSNTTGFQRAALLANDGEIETPQGAVGIEDLLLEEESAARIEESEQGVTFGLDRLGIPLVEIGTKPDIRSPEQARAAAERIGMLLRSTGKVKRGLGTIRQDVNVSITDGARVELKGVQSLDDLESIVREEVGRQVELLDIADELAARDAAVGDTYDVAEVFADTASDVIARAESVQALVLKGFDGLVGREIQPDRRLGTEFSDHAKRAGAGGIFHTDELPAYGVTDAEVTALRESVGADAADAVALVAADADVAAAAIEAVADRATAAVEGVPEETRDARPDGTSRYLRPLPGAARMYPETDVPPVEPDASAVEAPELLTERVDRYESEHGLDAGLAEQVAYGQFMTLYERAVEAGIDPTFAATTLESTLTELRRDDVPVDAIGDEALLAVMKLVKAGDLAKEGVDEVLATLAHDPRLSATAAVEEAGLSGVSEAEVREAVVEVVERNEAQVAEQGMAAFSGLMGEAMGALRGKADGEVVSSVLREEIGKRS